MTYHSRTALVAIGLLTCSGGLARAQDAAVNPDDAKMSVCMEAAKKGDFAFLEKVCGRQVNKNHVVDFACKAWLEELQNKKDVEALERICNTKPQTMPVFVYQTACRAANKLSEGNWDAKLANCDSLPADYQALREKHQYADNPFAIHLAAANSAFKCKKWEYFFGTMVADRTGIGNHEGWGVKLLKDLEKNQVDVLAALDTYIDGTKAPFGADNGCNGVVNLTTWMIDGKKFDNAEKYLKSMKKFNACGRAQFGRFFYAAKCAKAVSFFAEQLLSKDPLTLAVACNYLGDFGDKKHLARLNTLAKSEPTVRVEGVTKVYWVRDACKAAAGRIKLRK